MHTWGAAINRCVAAKRGYTVYAVLVVIHVVVSQLSSIVTGYILEIYPVHDCLRLGSLSSGNGSYLVNIYKVPLVNVV